MTSTVRPLQTALLASTQPRAWIPAFAFLVALLAIGATGFLLFKHHALEMEHTAHDQLAAVADLKVQQIVRWMGEQRRDAEVISRDDLLADEVERWFREGAPEGVMAQKILARLASLRQINQYEGVVLLDAKARSRLRVGDGQKFDSHDTNLALQAMRKNEVTLSDIHWSDGPKPEMDMVARLAVPGPQGPRVIGALYFHLDPSAFFFPYIQSWPTQSPSGETFLVRRDGNEVVFLNELRHRKGAALNLRLPIDQPSLEEAMALSGNTELTQGVDYRGVPVIAAARKVSDTPWMLVAKLDRAEVQAPIRDLAATAGGLAALFLLLAGAIAALWWRNRHAQFLAMLSEEKLQRQALEQHFDYATKFARDIILLFDETGRLVECNEAALAAYGYAREELLQFTLSELRSAQAVAAIPGDLERAARAGGITFETVDRRKDGSIFPIEASIRQIEIEGRRFYQSIVRDISARKQAEHSLQSETQRYRALMETAIDGIHIVDQNARLVEANPAFLRMIGYEKDEAIGFHVTDWDMHLSREEIPAKIASVLTRSEISETRWRRKDGSILDVELSISAIEIEGVTWFYCAGRDITDRKRAEIGIRRLNRVHEVLSGINALIMRVTDRDALFRGACRIAVEAGTFNMAWIGVVDRGAMRAMPVAHAGEVHATLPYIRDGIPLSDEISPGSNLASRAVRWKRPAISNDIRNDPQVLFKRVHAASGTRSVAVLPLLVSGEVIAILDLYTPEIGFFDAEEIKLLDELAENISFALEQLERNRHIAELTLARADAEQASVAKSAFLAAMSHEIRTPMNGVLGMVEVLAQSSLTEHQADLVNTIQASASTLLAIIDDILDFSKIEAGRLEIDRAPVCIGDLVESLAVSLAPMAAPRGVDLAVFVSPEIPQCVLSDDVRLRQLLYNLMGNAIKFSGGRPDRRGSVSIRLEVAEVVPLRLAFRIGDNGIGMARETLENLFTPFTQAEVSTTRRFGGTGLGLAICSRLVGLMRGDIAVESTLGVGSTFTVTLPLEPAPEGPGRDFPDLGGLDCIVVAGPNLNADDIRAYLEYAGARVQLATDIREAAQHAAELTLPVVVQDAGRDSVSLDALRAAFTGAPNASHLLITRGRRRVARIEAPEVVTLDGNVLRRLALLRAVLVAAGRASPERLHPGSEAPLPGKDRNALTVAEARTQGRLILVAEDDSINQKVILQQLGLLGHAAEIAGNGSEALRLWRQGSYALLLTDLHMPEMDGYELAENIRREEAARGDGQRRMPILALTANALRGEADRARAAGMDDYLTKPVQLRLLGAALAKWLPRINESAEPEGTLEPIPNGERRPTWT